MIDALSTKNLTNSAVTQPSPGVNEVTYSTDPGSGMNADVTVDWNGVPPDQIMTDMSVSLDETVDFTISGLNINFMTFNNAVQADRPDKAAGIAEVFQGIDWTVDLSQSTAANGLFGTGGDDTFFTGSGNDQLFLDGGVDTDKTGLGNDFIYAANRYDILVQGTASVDCGGGSDTFALDYRESGAQTLTFFGGGQTLDLSKGSFVETLDEGTNTIMFTSIENSRGTIFGDKLLGSKVANSLKGEEGNDTLLGRDGKDILIGGAGNDRLTGGTGADVIIGGSGKDVFIYAAADGSNKQFDVIADFRHNMDKLELSAVKLPKHTDFVLIGDQTFSHHAGEIQIIQHDAKGVAHDYTEVNVDLDAGGKADMQIQLTRLVNLDKHDFLF
jgi:Ca2+-binding RTX toxin-like protein